MSDDRAWSVVIVVGHVSLDEHILVREIPPANQDVMIIDRGELPGGAAANVAAASARSGVQTRLVSAVGNDEPGDSLLGELGLHGVDLALVRRDPERPTSRLTLVKDLGGNRSFYLDPAGASSDVTGTDIPRRGSEPSTLAFVGSPLRWVASVVSDLDGWHIAGALGFWAAGRELDELTSFSVFNRFQHLFLNSRESEALPRAFRAWLDDEWIPGGGTLVTTAGREPTVVRQHDQTHTVAVLPLTAVVDTIGCGDAFMGAYIAATLAGLGPVESCELGHAAAGAVAQSHEERPL